MWRRFRARSYKANCFHRASTETDSGNEIIQWQTAAQTTINMIYKRTVGRSYTAATAHNIASQEHFHVQQTCALFMKAPGSGVDAATYTTIKCHYNQAALPLCHMQAPATLLLHSLPVGCHHNPDYTATYNRPRLCTHKLLVVTVQKLLTLPYYPQHSPYLLCFPTRQVKE